MSEIALVLEDVRKKRKKGMDACRARVNSDENIKKRYRINCRLLNTILRSSSSPVGKGSFDFIKKASHKGKSVVVKFQDSSAIFYNETYKHQCLKHKYIVKLYGASTYPECIVTKFINGKTLCAYLASNGKNTSKKNRIRLGIQIAEAMEYIHQKGVVHCQLSDLNIMVDISGNIKIINFGLSKDSGIDYLSQCGSFLFMDPRVVENGRSAYSVKSDIYSYSLLLYQIMTLNKPVPLEYKDRVREWAIFVSKTGYRFPLNGIQVDVANVIQNCWGINNQDLSFSKIKQDLKSIYSKLYGSSKNCKIKSPFNKSSFKLLNKSFYKPINKSPFNKSKNKIFNKSFNKLFNK